ncbi:hypothetical protein CEUSTIGMA_g9852.t1 [Chlamydomonas eustigma]|uniref:Uncharacterized protein n=1 Tax=Chlamydomonas eustigma TaxID=1157962 RepID=A0A250XH69_9CHLO|nr:hypothetical protein CEUSTIGMA_g9852.t1 [Chlamydomonas eustigma]|eukprot:GAX82424.1 hypothetical protein CEUSTIGMA_g9852.t1 [Chlamydomonas eustigma]
MPQWLPKPSSTPTFLRCSSNETTVRALTESQVELFKMKTAYARLSTLAVYRESEWLNRENGLEDEIRQLQVRSAEAERLYNDQLRSLQSAIEENQERLRELQGRHHQLKNSSADTIDGLRRMLQALERTCDELKGESERLKDKLQNAEVTEELKRRAELRAAELESALNATQDKAREMIEGLDKQWRTAGAERDKLAGQLSAASESLNQESERRKMSELEALRLAVDKQKLLTELEIERLINAPLRETNYAATTLAHVMRSSAAGSVGQHALASPGSSLHAGVPTLYEGSVNMTPTRAGEGSSYLQLRLQHGVNQGRLPVSPSLGESFANRNLTRLGRSWATTTPTAGHPHPDYLDNVERFRQRYAEVSGLLIGGSSRSGHNSQDVVVTGRSTTQANASPPGTVTFLTPQKPRVKLGGRGSPGSSKSTGKTLKY